MEIKQMNKITGFFKKIKNTLSSIIEEVSQVEWIKGSKVVKYTVLIVLFIVLGSFGIVLLDKLFLSLRLLVIPQ